jgi:MFS transporter, putative metabolite:H+ symporter
MRSENKNHYGLLSLPVLVGALGFFVDVYDLLLFNIVRISSLTDLGVDKESLKTVGESILSLQMIGLMIGGILWGMMGDKRGRKSVLFGSIILYSLATLANGFVQTVEQYTLLRFIAAIGLAGELGASITLTSEMLSKEKRGLASTIIATSGIFGTTAAYYVHYLSDENWRLCYFIGGGMGLALLLLRVGIFESRLYDSMRSSHVSMGNLFMLVNKRERFFRYLRCILVGLPVWYCIGVVISFSDEYARQFGISDFNQPKALMLQYLGVALGDISAGLLSNFLKSRRKALMIFYGILALFLILFFGTRGGSSAVYMYLMCIGLGFGSGLSVLYITMSAELFGTNLRATTAISIPNFVRGALPLMLLLFQFLRSENVFNNYITGAWVTGAIVMVSGLLSVIFTKETYGMDMNYLEE